MTKILHCSLFDLDFEQTSSKLTCVNFFKIAKALRLKIIMIKLLKWGLKINLKDPAKVSIIDRILSVEFITNNKNDKSRY